MKILRWILVNGWTVGAIVVALAVLSGLVAHQARESRPTLLRRIALRGAIGLALVVLAEVAIAHNVHAPWHAAWSGVMPPDDDASLSAPRHAASTGAVPPDDDASLSAPRHAASTGAMPSDDDTSLSAIETRVSIHALRSSCPRAAVEWLRYGYFERGALLAETCSPRPNSPTASGLRPAPGLGRYSSQRDALPAHAWYAAGEFERAAAAWERTYQPDFDQVDLHFGLTMHILAGHFARAAEIAHDYQAMILSADEIVPSHLGLLLESTRQQWLEKQKLTLGWRLRHRRLECLTAVLDALKTDRGALDPILEGRDIAILAPCVEPAREDPTGPWRTITSVASEESVVPSRDRAIAERLFAVAAPNASVLRERALAAARVATFALAEGDDETARHFAELYLTDAGLLSDQVTVLAMGAEHFTAKIEFATGNAGRAAELLHSDPWKSSPVVDAPPRRGKPPRTPTGEDLAEFVRETTMEVGYTAEYKSRILRVSLRYSSGGREDLLRWLRSGWRRSWHRSPVYQFAHLTDLAIVAEALGDGGLTRTLREQADRFYRALLQLPISFLLTTLQAPDPDICRPIGCNLALWGWDPMLAK